MMIATYFGPIGGELIWQIVWGNTPDYARAGFLLIVFWSLAHLVRFKSDGRISHRMLGHRLLGCVLVLWTLFTFCGQVAQALVTAMDPDYFRALLGMGFGPLLIGLAVGILQALVFAYTSKGGE